MKDEFIAVVIAIIFIALFVFNSHVMEAGSKRLASYIDKVEISGNIDIETIDNIRSLWEKDKKLLKYLTCHENILKVDECVEMSKECLESGKSDRAMYLLKLARHYVEDLKEREKISLDNIF